jgi:hypothetical protein
MFRNHSTRQQRVAWNKGKLIGQKGPLRKEIWAIRIHLQLAHRTCKLALCNLGIDSKLRGCDLAALQVCDVAQGGRVPSQAIVMQRKTHCLVQVELTEQTREAVHAWITQAKLGGDQFLFPSRLRASPHLSMRQYAKVVEAWSRRLDSILPSMEPIPCGEQKRC